MKEIEYDIINECWICKSHSTNSEGYPVVRRNRKKLLIHRFFYSEYNGCIPTGMIIRHSCDNRKCINPAHLLIGTHADNVADRVKRNRSAKGEKNGRCKLKFWQVEIIRNDIITPKCQLARRFGVDPKLIRLIKNGKLWKQEIEAH